MVDYSWPGRETTVEMGGCWPAIHAAVKLGWLLDNRGNNHGVSSKRTKNGGGLLLAKHGDRHSGGWLLANNGDSHGGWWLLASEGHSHGIIGFLPAMKTTMVVGCRWPAVNTAMELMVAGQQ